MAVFTTVGLPEVSDWIGQFPLGEARAVRGIASGIENSNFFLTTDAGEYVLTIFENLGFEQLPFYLELMRHLAARGVLVPAPVANRDGALCVPLLGKPAAIVSKLAGQSQMAPQAHHCAQVGAMLAKMHIAARDFPLDQPNLRGIAWWNETAPKVLPHLSAAEAALLESELAFQNAFAGSDACRQLERAPVHADLFRNNVMFDGDRLTGFFDFYFAGVDTLLFDIAVTVNDWCVDPGSGALDAGRVRALADAYGAVRPFTAAEALAWQPMLRAAALRFWLSRLHDLHAPRDAALLTPHDPTHFERILRQRIGHTPPALFNAT
ncbi:homoserine kinase [Pseudoduganella sp. GCM10020061]|uniref:homoserine kinase n=1 Tax=Pseudoduganella sp. GCM10020061 TaxID=3317345 RepID=UPI003640A7D5